MLSGSTPFTSDESFRVALPRSRSALPSEIPGGRNADLSDVVLAFVFQSPDIVGWSATIYTNNRSDIPISPCHPIHHVRQRHLLHSQTLQQDRPHHRRLGRDRRSDRDPLCARGSQRDHLGATKGSISKGCRGGEKGEQGGPDGPGWKGV